MNRYILCFPICGFNDIINHIYKCLIYAIQFNRLLVIDTTKSPFKDDINNYFDISHQNIFSGNLSDFYELVSENNTFPKISKQLLINKDNFFPNGLFKHIPLEIDLNKDYDETFIIYNNKGWGKNLIDFFDLFPLKSYIIDMYNERRNKLPRRYVSVHIRNTDYKSNVEFFLTIHLETIKKNTVFLASDNLDTINYIKNRFGNNIITFSEIPPLENNLNIHIFNYKVPTKSFNTDIILDLLLLASGDRYIYSSPESLYSKAALSLHKNKHILNKILKKV